MTLCQVPHVLGGGCRWKSQNRKNVYLSPYVETFNSKVIKGFVPELRSRYVFLVFRDSYVLCIYVMNILCTFPIFMYGYVTLQQRVGVGATPFPGLLHFNLDPYLIMLSVKQGNIKYHFLSLWYDSTWDWTQVSRAIGEHSNHYTNVF